MLKLIVCILLNLCVVCYVAASVYFPLKNQELKRLVRSPNPHHPPCEGFPPFPGPPLPPLPPPPPPIPKQPPPPPIPEQPPPPPIPEQPPPPPPIPEQPPAPLPHDDCHYNGGCHGSAGDNFYPEIQGNAELKSHETSGDTESIGNEYVEQNLPSAALISPGGNKENGLTKATATAYAEAQSNGGSASAQASAKATAVSHQSKICYFCKITDNSN